MILGCGNLFMNFKLPQEKHTDVSSDKGKDGTEI